MNNTPDAPQKAFELKGRIDSQNAAETEAELRKAISAAGGGEIVLNAENLDYISSAGLRMLVRLRQDGRKVKIVNVSPAVYETFDVTGFTGLFEVRRTLRKIRIGESELLAKGTIGTIYRIDDDTVVKVFNSRITMDLINRERDYAQKAFLAGIPAVITYDVVDVNGRYGIISEMAKGTALSERLNAAGDGMDALISGYTELLKRIHAVSVPKGTFPDAKDIYHGYVDAAGYLDGGQKKSLHRLIGAVPDALTVLHGDFHANNVMFQDGAMVVIDLSDVSLGSPLFDLAGMYVSHVAVGGYHPGFIRAGMGISYDTCLKLWNGFFDRYFASSAPEEREKKLDVVRRFAMLKLALMYAIAPGLDALLGWKPLEDAGRILFTGEMDRLADDAARFGV